jgi:hypothetical protein
VTDSLNCIHELQQREVELTREVALLRGFMEAAQEEGEAERIRIMQVLLGDDAFCVGVNGSLSDGATACCQRSRWCFW